MNFWNSLVPLVVLNIIMASSNSGNDHCECICDENAVHPEILVEKSCKKPITWKCPTGFSEVDKYCFKIDISDNNISRKTAQNICKKNGGNLFSFQNNSKVKAFDQWVRKLYGLHQEPDDNCQGPADITFILDVSTSVTERNFEISKKFVLDVVSKFNLGSGEDQTRVAVVTYSNHSRIEMHLNKFNNFPEFKDNLRKVKYDSRNVTYTNRALKFVGENVIIRERGARAGVTKIIVLLTDGLSWDAQFPAAPKLKNMGVKIFVIGIGRYVLDSELSSMASKPNSTYLMKVADFKNLTENIDKLKDNICESGSLRFWIDENSIKNKSAQIHSDFSIKDGQPSGKCVAIEVDKKISFFQKIKCTGDEGVACEAKKISSYN